MPLDYRKELTPVLYGDSAVKILDESRVKAGGICFGTHWHERMELLLVLCGTLQVCIGNASAAAGAGSVVIIPPGQPHTGYAGSSGVSYRAIMFDVTAFFNSSNASSKLLKPVADQKVCFMPVSDNPETFDILRSVLDEQLCGDNFSPLIVVGKIYETLGMLYRHCLCRNAPAQRNNKFRNVIDYIEAHYREEISSASLSRVFGYDKSYFCRRFKTVTGLTPMSYIQILRLETARKIIEDGGLKISEVSAACGFSDAGYFTRRFKKQYGLTPSEYSANINNNGNI